LRRAVGLGLVFALLGFGWGAVKLLDTGPSRRAAVSSPPRRGDALPLPRRAGAPGADWMLELQPPDVRTRAVGTPLAALSWSAANAPAPREPLLLDGLPLELHVPAASAPVAEAPLASLLVGGGTALAAWRARRRARGQTAQAIGGAF